MFAKLCLCTGRVSRVFRGPQALDELHFSEQPGPKSREWPGRQEQVKLQRDTMCNECRRISFALHAHKELDPITL